MQNKRIKQKQECRQAWADFQEVRNIEKEIVGAVCDLEIHYPKKPKYDEIANYGFTKKNRKFPKQDWNYIQYIDSLDETDEEKIQYLDQMHKIWEEGFWFYNGDRLEYITGNHYMMLQYFMMRVTDSDTGREMYDRPNFIDAQRDLFLVIKEAKNNPDVGGVVFTTMRRWGKTVCICADGYFDTIDNEAFQFFTQSKSEDDAEGILRKIVSSWQKMPNFLRPINNGFSTSKSEISFTQPQQRSSDGKFEYIYTLGSRIAKIQSSETALDGMAANYVYNDEAGKLKIQIADAYKRWNVNKYCILNGKTISGFGVVTTTVEDVDGGSVMRYKKLVDQSNWRTRNKATNRTNTLLIRLFFPATYGMKGSARINDEHIEFSDEWGYSNIGGTKKYVVASRAGLEGKDLEDEIRKSPLTLDECFLAKEGGNNFNIKKITDQKSHNAAHGSKNPLVRGNFIYLENERKVVFRPNQDGKWLVRWMPPEQDRNRMEMEGSQYKPTRTFCKTGVDPFDHRGRSDGSGSNGAAVTILKDPMFFRKPTVVCLYVHRPKTPTELWKDILYQCIFYSSEALVENNKYGMLEYWSDRGFDKFAMTHPFDPNYYSKSGNRGLPMTDPFVREAVMSYGQEFVEDNIGIDAATGEMADCWYDELLEDLRKFNPQKWTDYDLSVAFMLAVTAFRRVERKESRRSTVDLSGLAPKLDLGKQRTLR